MRLEILHNVTTDSNGRHAPFTRTEPTFSTMPGDQLVRVGELYAADGIKAATQAAEFAFDAGNNPDDSKPSVILYRTWQVRSLSVGDVVVLHHTGGDVAALACEPGSWRIIDLGDFDVERPALTHAQGNAMLAAIITEFAIQRVAHELRWFAARDLSATQPGLIEIGSSDVSIHLAHLANHQTARVREEAEWLRQRQELVRQIAASTGRSETETLHTLRRLLGRPAEH